MQAHSVSYSFLACSHHFLSNYISLIDCNNLSVLPGDQQTTSWPMTSARGLALTQDQSVTMTIYVRPQSFYSFRETPDLQWYYWRYILVFERGKMYFEIFARNIYVCLAP
jgi:hypothetical protein